MSQIDIPSSVSNNSNPVAVKKKMTAKRFFRLVWRREKLMIFIIIGVTIGFLVGTLANGPIRKLGEPTRTDVQIGVEFIGKIFLQCLRLIILPLIISSLIRGMASLDPGSAGRVGVGALVYYFCTTILAVVLGIILVVSIQPGRRASYTIVTDESIKPSRPMDLFLDIVRNMFPENIVQATFQTVKTTSKSVFEYVNTSEFIMPINYTSWPKELQDSYLAENSIIGLKDYENGTIMGYSGQKREYLLPDSTIYNNGINMLGIITFSIVFGIFLGKLKEKGEALLSVLEAIEFVSTKMIGLIMWISPVGIACLIIGQFWKIDNISSVFASLGLYIATIMAGLIIHFFLTIFLIYFIFTRKSPITYLKNMLKAVVTGFATASSSATIPVTLQCLDENNHVDPRVSRFMIPVGATVNMDGTALYEAVAAIFIAQVYGADTSIGNVILTSITATLASIGAAGVPQGGLVTLVIVLQVLGLPGDSLGLILSVDWLLDRFRTVINILGDAFGCGVIESVSKKQLGDLQVAPPSSNDSGDSPAGTSVTDEVKRVEDRVASVDNLL